MFIARLLNLRIAKPNESIFGNDVAERLNQQPRNVAPQHVLHFADGHIICYYACFAMRTEASLVDLAIKLNVLAVFAVIAFVSAILLGAF